MPHWLEHVLGLDDAAGVAYLFWSGVGSDLGELGIIVSLIATYRRHTCHVDHPRFCWRPGIHPVAGTSFRLCHHHHPTAPDKISAAHIVGAYADAIPRGDS